MTTSTSATLCAAEINALPEHVRRYVYDLETRCDPAGDVQTIASLREQVAGLLAERARSEPIVAAALELARRRAEKRAADRTSRDAFNRAHYAHGFWNPDAPPPVDPPHQDPDKWSAADVCWRASRLSSEGGPRDLRFDEYCPHCDAARIAWSARKAAAARLAGAFRTLENRARKFDR